MKLLGEDGYTQYSSEVQYSFDEIENKMKEKYKNFTWEKEKRIEITDYTESGRVKSIKIGNTEIAGTEARSILGLKSTNFNVSITEDKVMFKVIGYGHGVGMSQTGADSLAKNGYNCEQIIEHFYRGTIITELEN